MANDQFTIPDSQEYSLDEAMSLADSSQHTPEQMSPYSRIKAVEDRSHGYRRTALEIEEGRELSFLESMLGGKRAKITLEGLINAESAIGGGLFGEGNRFWLSHKGSSILAGGNHIGDWFHVRDEYDQYGRKVGEVTLHFETHPDRIVKLHEGRPVEPTLAELETFVRAVELYEQRIREALYPFDQEIFDLIAEIDDENFVAPASLEERFGKEIVARVNEAYKQSKR